MSRAGGASTRAPAAPLDLTADKPAASALDGADNRAGTQDDGQLRTHLHVLSLDDRRAHSKTAVEPRVRQQRYFAKW